MRPYMIITFICSLIINTCFGQSIRKDYNELTSDEKKAYVNALYELMLAAVQELQKKVKELESRGN